ncbi:hypothetical protein [Methanoculleus chikugoensis]|uniref:hypothetical protein n=1 Tax=Methanoculleus chikugoensis TaxID=118126 RepID=UPI000A69458A|nr:hypothetical protein [Methanoculleus chikugoensis]
MTPPVFSGIRVSAFLAWKSIQRGSRGTLALTIMIIALIFVNLVFLPPSIISGVVVTFDTQSIDFDLGNLVIEPPREGNRYIDGVDGLQKKIEQIPGGITGGTSPRITAGATFFYRGGATPRARSTA